MHAEGRKLDDHCRVHHEKCNNGFLMHGNMPPNPVYSNFEEYLNGNAETLVKDPNVHKDKRGRKPNDA